MKRVLASLVLLLFGWTAYGNEPTVTKEERVKALKLLRDSQKEFLDAVESLTDTQWSFKPAPDRWSVGQVAEHITLSEDLLFGLVQKTLAGSPNPDWETKTEGKNELVERLLLNRQTKAQAPEVLQPQSKLTRDEILVRFKQSRAKTIKFMEQTDLPMKAHTFDHAFPVFGTLNAYQWLIYIPLHNMRHNQQIAEVKADPNFPR